MPGECSSTTKCRSVWTCGSHLRYSLVPSEKTLLWWRLWQPRAQEGRINRILPIVTSTKTADCLSPQCQFPSDNALSLLTLNHKPTSSSPPQEISSFDWPSNNGLPLMVERRELTRPSPWQTTRDIRRSPPFLQLDRISTPPNRSPIWSCISTTSSWTPRLTKWSQCASKLHASVFGSCRHATPSNCGNNSLGPWYRLWVAIFTDTRGKLRKIMSSVKLMRVW